MSQLNVLLSAQPHIRQTGFDSLSGTIPRSVRPTKYCYVHGWNFSHHAKNQPCNTMKGDAAYTNAMRNSGSPMKVPGGSTNVQTQRVLPSSSSKHRAPTLTLPPPSSPPHSGNNPPATSRTGGTWIRGLPVPGASAFESPFYHFNNKQPVLPAAVPVHRDNSAALSPTQSTRPLGIPPPLST